MKIRIFVSFFLLLCLILTKNAYSAKVRISGTAPDYTSQSFYLNMFHDFISEEKINLGKFQFDSNGNFKLEFDLTETTLCFADFDGYHAMLYLEPGKSYEILLPPKRNLTETQKRNPFVKPDPVWLGIVNPTNDELNFRIQQFEQSYLNYENKYFDQIFVNQSGSLVDTIKTKLGKDFPKTNSAIFEAHKFFREAGLEFALNQGKSAAFMKTYFSNIQPYHYLSAYTTMFNQVFQNYFNVLAISAHGNEIKKMTGSSDLQELEEYFQKELHFNRELAHFVLLKSLYDAYYSKQFSKASILKMLEQVKSSGWTSYEQKIAKLLITKLTYLTSGTIPPTINLKSLDGKKVSLSDFQNSYIYLHFTDPKNSICRQHLDALKPISVHYKGKLVIINVISDGADFRNEKDWPGIFATTENNIEEIFKVKTFPNSFLIGKDGKLLLSPAPNPIDGLDRQMGQILKSDYYKEMQKSANTNAK